MHSKYETADPIYKNAVSFLYGVSPSLDKPSSDSTVKMYPNTNARISATCYIATEGLKHAIRSQRDENHLPPIEK